MRYLFFILFILSSISYGQDKKIMITHNYENYYILTKKVYKNTKPIYIRGYKMYLTNEYKLEHVNTNILYKLYSYYSKDGKQEHYVIKPILLCWTNKSLLYCMRKKIRYTLIT